MSPMRISAYAVTGVWAVLTVWGALRGDAWTWGIGAIVLLIAAYNLRPARVHTDESS